MTCKSYTGRANINIYHGDCMEFMKDKPAKYWNVTITDPPYGIKIMKQWGNTNNGYRQYETKEWDNNPPDENYFNELFRVGHNQIIWGANYFTNFLPPSQGWVIWDLT